VASVKNKMDSIIKLIIGPIIGIALLASMGILLVCAYELGSKPVVYVHNKIVKGVKKVKKLIT